jgi:diguanylate cyclase (GGDEF)-like protein
MNYRNFLSSNFDFDENESLLKFKFKMLNSSMLVISIMTFIIGFMSQIGVNDIGFAQMTVNYLHAASTLALLLLLRLSKELFLTIGITFVIICLLNITSALILVTQDEFRLMWFFVVIYLAYMLDGARLGLIITGVSILLIIFSNMLFDLRLSSFAISTSLYGIIISSLLMRAHAQKIEEFEQSILSQNKQLKQLSSVDHLTGLMNQRVFNEVSANCFETGKRHDNDIIVLSLDIDNLRHINSTYGHQVGDMLIVRFTEVIQALLRKSDIFARLGGHKFIILLYKTDLPGALKLAEKIRIKIKAILLSHENDFIQITTSIGISPVTYEDSSIIPCLERSEKALLQAKKEGKDRICLFNQEAKIVSPDELL